MITLQHLHELSMALTGPLDLDSHLKLILETAVELHQAQYGLLSVYNPVSGCLESVANIGFSEEALKQISRVRPTPQAGACGIAFVTKNRTIIEDVTTDPIFHCFREITNAIKFRAAHITPILTGSNEILGLLCLYFEAAGKPSAYQIQFTDICVNHAAAVIDAAIAKQALRDSEQRFQTLADNAPVMVWVSDPNGFCTFLSKAWYDFTGQTAETGHGFGWLQAIHPDDRADIEKIYREPFENRRNFQFEYRLLNKQNEYRWTLDAVAPWFGMNGEFLGYIGSAMDISERVRIEQTVQEINTKMEARVKERTLQLERQSNRLRILADQVVTTEQRERKRIAAILHDNLQQILVAGTFQLAEASRSIQERRFENVAQFVDRSKHFLSKAISAARSLTTELRPPVLYEDGLPRALEWLAQKFKREHDLEVLLNLEEIEVPLSDSLKITVFESIKELLFNVVKHAQVKQASLTFKVLFNHILYICIEDKGIGFQVSQRGRAFESEGGLGLFGMHERFKILNADFEISSPSRKGTKVEIRIPLENIPALSADTELKQTALFSQSNISDKENLDTVSILLVDDHKIVREGIANLLKSNPLFQVVAQAENGLEAVEKAAVFLPNVIIMDINMPKLNGIEATRFISKNFPQIKIIGLSVQDENDAADSMKKAGALCLLNKTDAPEVLIQTILKCTQNTSAA